MPASPVTVRAVTGFTPGPVQPLLPILTVASWKGGTWKTALAVSASERLAFGGLRILLLTVDAQEDARKRLGVAPSAEPYAQVFRGGGSVTVVGLRGSRAVDVLYRNGPSSLGTFDLAVLDCPPTLEAGRLPGVLLVVPVDGRDAAMNAVSMLRAVPANSRIVLVRVGSCAESEDWEADAQAIADAANRDAKYIPDPLPPSPSVKEAHDEGRSVWALPRRGRTRKFLSGVETLAALAWEHARLARPMPPPPPSASVVCIPGWDDEDAA